MFLNIKILESKMSENITYISCCTIISEKMCMLESLCMSLEIYACCDFCFVERKKVVKTRKPEKQEMS